MHNHLMEWHVSREYHPDALGLLPMMLNPMDVHDAVTQFDRNYAHGGGWHDFEGFTLNKRDSDNPLMWWLEYDGDPPMTAIAHTKLHDEIVVLFKHSWVLVLQPNGVYRVARMD